MILQIYNWSIVFSALILLLHTIPDKEVQEVLPQHMNKYTILFLSIVPVLNTTLVFAFVWLEVIVATKDYLMFEYVIWKIKKNYK